MNKVFAIVLAVAMMLMSTVPVLAAEVTTRDLIIDGGFVDPITLDRGTDIGGISVDLTSGVVSVTYTIDDPNWEILETHVYISNTQPTKHSPGKFNASNGEGVPVGSGTVYVAAHAELRMIDPISGEPILDEVTGDQITETAWAQNEDFTNDTLFRSTGKGSYWATYFTITAP